MKIWDILFYLSAGVNYFVIVAIIYGWIQYEKQCRKDRLKKS